MQYLNLRVACSLTMSTELSLQHLVSSISVAEAGTSAPRHSLQEICHFLLPLRAHSPSSPMVVLWEASRASIDGHKRETGKLTLLAGAHPPTPSESVAIKTCTGLCTPTPRWLHAHNLAGKRTRTHTHTARADVLPGWLKFVSLRTTCECGLGLAADRP